MKARKPGFFATCLGLQLRLVRRRLPALLAMALAALVLSCAAAGAALGLAKGQQLGNVTIAVASRDEDERIETLIGLFSQMRDIRAFATVVFAGAEEAGQMVADGDAVVAVITPEGFWQSVLSGENLSPTVVMDASRPVEMALMTKLAESVTRMLARAQQGVNFTLKALEGQARASGGVDDSAAVDKAVTDINLKYITWVLGRGGMFHSATARAGGDLGLAQSYLLSAVLFFAALAVPVLHPLYSLRGQAGWMGRLRGGGSRFGWYVLAQVLAGAAALFCMLVLLLAGGWGAGFLLGAGGAPSLWALPGVLLAAVCLSAFGFLCCNTGGILSAVGINFTAAVLMLLTSGGFIPLVLLPGPIAALGPFSPMGWARQALAPVFGVGVGAVAAPLAALGALAAALVAGCLGLARRAERKGAVA